MKEQLFQIITYFMIYSFLGWIMESVVRSIIEKKIINTGFLIGPICPIYGIGSIIIILFLNRFENNIFLLFIISMLVLTLWEYIVGVLLEAIFHTKYWDYSNHKINFQGRICLTNSVCWGLLGIAFVKYIHPFIENIIFKLDNKLLGYIITITFLVFLCDMIVSIIKVKNIRVTLEKVEELNKEIKEKLQEIKMLAKESEKNIEKAVATENIKQLVEKLKKKRNKTILRLYRNVNRLKKAFPAINTKEIAEVLSNKIDSLKKQKNIKSKK